MKIRNLAALPVALSALGLWAGIARAESTHHDAVPDEVIAAQRMALAKNTLGLGFGPQAPRDIGQAAGQNTRAFGMAPPYTEMNLCDIHMHESAEHRGGEFTTYAGNGDGEGSGTGYLYSGQLSDAELTPIEHPVGQNEHGELTPGDTIEVHYVFSTAQARPGPTLATCLSEAINNPQLRVEAQVFVLVNDENALDFNDLAKVEYVNGVFQPPNLPADTGTPVVYAGSTTGPQYNEKGSPFQVTWSVRPNVARLDINSLGVWFKDNIFHEDHAHGSRNLVTDPALLSPIAPSPVAQ